VTLGGFQQLFGTTNRKLNFQRSDNSKFSIIIAMHKDVNIFPLHARVRQKVECYDAEIRR
jgi:hypothetical protein